MGVGDDSQQTVSEFSTHAYYDIPRRRHYDMNKYIDICRLQTTFPKMISSTSLSCKPTGPIMWVRTYAHGVHTSFQKPFESDQYFIACRTDEKLENKIVQELSVAKKGEIVRRR